MKKIIFALFAIAFMATAQTSTMNKIEADRGYVLWQTVDWSAFTSDSLATVYTLPMSVSDLDSVVEVWVRGTSANGSSKFRVVLQGGFKNSTTTTDWDSLGQWCDSIFSKTETLERFGVLYLRGANYVRAKIYGNADEAAPSATTNRKDTKVTLYLIGRKYGYEQISN